ncbi:MULTISPECIES: helicase HerA domain-containing protein [Desulfococcus]|uniref:Helicase HerA central domain-containing protein n=1 Tax=Desulfococcus multivorans DSM 2059 TaxID=1121405 RepID=S7TW66_DESML|nr:DUF87 domain-containing protein [Desulfococcus multivorans]AOY58146.1 conserved uncharacterized protein, DUF87 [Desulfococcus multivorans]AQV00499.1 ATP-binding protein [Desulfococcus multivorans]EPR41287.1 protein of unknown function DUF87 [Desulfococcus multivorans DSM 2059]SJZ73812.1 AAA-like domain-containing protein [Desulfococcus multivorans DSM 2059]
MKKIYEKLGAFYLGRIYDPKDQCCRQDLMLYDAKDLTTHAVIIGMTGSGKTGLGIGLIEEALIDGIPVIAIDPKGDLPNLLLRFPDLNAEAFQPWISLEDAARQGIAPEAYAAQQAETWRAGLAEWDQEPERIARLRAAADIAVYTPGSTAGRPVSLLHEFAPPPAGAAADSDFLQEVIASTVTGLLALLGIDANPISSREHILLANIFENAWAEDRTLDLAGLIQTVQFPPFNRIGVMALEAFFPEKDRFALAMRLNNLLAVSGFAAWMEGPPLDIPRFLYTDQGTPRASIFTISHLTESRRMFFVTLLLNRIIGWIRSQPGTTSLRAILYMDEIFGYFPPVSNPPSKKPLLNLLKQARAFGLGVVLSTQNPVDLDYKGLANMGTWFIGRLQTEQDRARVLAGLDSAAAVTGFDRDRMDGILSRLGKRVFLLHNVHETRPVIFQTRWTLSYLSGPMTRDQIRRLTGPVPETIPEPISTTGSPPPALPSRTAIPPLPPPGIDTYYLPASGAGAGDQYLPGLIGRMSIHYRHLRYGVDLIQSVTLFAQFQNGPVPLDWGSAVPVASAALGTVPPDHAEYAELPPAAHKTAAYDKWRKDLLRWVRLNRPLTIYQATALKLTSRPGESESAFRIRVSLAEREARDTAIEKLRRKYADRFARLQDRLMLAEQAVERERDQVRSQGLQSAVSFGGAILGAFLGRKVASAASASRMGTAVKSAGRIHKEKKDVDRAVERANAVRDKIAALDLQFRDDIDAVEKRFSPRTTLLETVAIAPKRNDITLDIFGLAWLACRQPRNR